MKYRFLRFPAFRTKAVTLSYDDGAREDIRLVEILNRYNMRATFNLCSSCLEEGSPYRLSFEECKTVFDGGHHEIAVHGANHVALIRTTPLNGIREILECRTKLEQQLHRLVRGMAYPDIGDTSPEIETYLSQLGIVYARTVKPDSESFSLPTDWYHWIPTCHHNCPELEKYVDHFLQKDPDKEYCSHRDPMLFYLWGHSFQFTGDNNWEVIENFCKKIGGHDDIWYATNIEIYEYVHAYDSLIFSADNHIVYNPSLLTVYFDIDGKQYQIASGETLEI